MKKPFYFFLKALFVLKIFKFLFYLFGHVEKRLELISKFVMPQPGKQTIMIHISPNISQNKGNHSMKFGQFLENNNRNIDSPQLGM